jgi:hypothetical protein
LIAAVVCDIIEPHNPLQYSVGDDAFFNWTTRDGKTMFSASWGIQKGNVADPQFINTNVYTKVVNFNKNIDAKYKYRLLFVGNLSAGHAWFMIKNLSTNDTNEYIASIRDDESGYVSYTVHLVVKIRGKSLILTDIICFFL